MKRLIAFFLVIIISILMCSTNVTAAEGNTLTLTQAKELALKNSPEIKKIEISQKLADIEEREAHLAYEEARAMYVYTRGAVQAKAQMDAAKKMYDAAKYANEDLKKTAKNVALKLEYGVEKLYLNMLNLKSSIKIAESNLKRLKDLLEIERSKLEMGLSTVLQVENVIQQVRNIERQLKELNDNYESLKWQLNRQIGRAPTSNIVLAPVEFRPVEYGDNLNSSTESALKALLALEQFNRTIDDKKREIEHKKFTESDKVERLEIEILDIESSIDDSQFQVNYSVKNCWDKLYLARENIVNSQAKYDSAKKEYDFTELRYNLGMIAKIELDGALLLLEQAAVGLEQAAYDYYLAARELYLTENGILLN